MNSPEWWLDCFPQWKGRHMTTPNGQPSVTSLDAQVTRNIEGSNIGDEAQRQAAAMGSRVINTDADGSVYGDESSESVTAPRGPQT